MAQPSPQKIEGLQLSPYQELKVNEIRLAHIRPASSEQDELVCSLETVSLKNTPRYQALSYSWGSPNERDQGHIYFEIGEQRVKWLVTPTLVMALRKLRHHDNKSLYIWADAICIDQGNLIERGEQVQCMRAIYQQATEVSVWLGPEDDNSPLAWRLIREIEKISSDNSKLIDLIQPTRKEDFMALIALFRREYFWRIWVVQEIACAKKAMIYCGSESISWTSLLDVCDKIQKVKDPLRDSIFHFEPAALFSLLSGGPRKLMAGKSWGSPYSESTALPLQELLELHMSKGSTDPQDKVYGLVGVSADFHTFGKIDYERSTRNTYIHTALYIIKSTQKLNLICIKQNDDNKYHLPSWVPDWERRNLYPSHRVMGLHIRRPQFTASKNTLAKTLISRDGEVLTASGFIIDTVVALSDPLYVHGHEREVEPTLRAFHNWLNLFMEHIGAEQLPTFQKTFCGGAWAPQYSEFEEDLTQRLVLFLGLTQRLLPQLLHESISNLPNYNNYKANDDARQTRERSMVSSAALRMHAKRLMISHSKLAGLAPMNTEIDDKIIVLFGCDFPVVMRDMGSYWTLIGEIYVDGIMNGEAMDHMAAGEYFERSFDIR